VKPPNNKFLNRRIHLSVVLAAGTDSRKIAALEPFLGRSVEGDMLGVCGVHHRFAIAWAAVACALLAAAPFSANAADPIASCPEAMRYEDVAAASARDGTTIRLVDGREVRLAGVAGASEIDGDAEASAKTTAKLHSLVAGKSLSLYGPKNLVDRYGRIVAQVALAGDGAQWVQGDLVSDGLLRVAPETSEIPCARPLLDLEAEARTGRKGLWQETRFAVEQAENIAALTAASGRFTVVEGIVRHIGETSSHTYLDFGGRYNEDFSVVIPRRARAGFAAAGIDLKNLRGKRVRVRGVLFQSGGPAIEINAPASLELVAGGST
jgi:endonuclease YncB( thermonuclease family)